VNDKSASPEMSRTYNQQCSILYFFDTHDVWHFLAAYSLGILCLAIQLLDEDLIDKRRESIVSF